MADDPSASAPTHYRVRLEPTDSPGLEIPALALVLNEHRSGGWTGNVWVNPKVENPEGALQTLLADGLAAGEGMLIKLVLAGDTPLAGATMRVWPSVITSVQTVASTNATALESFCTVTFRDPISHFRSQPIWSAFAHCSLAEMLGGALAAAAGGDGRPTANPVLPAMPVVRIRQQVRSEITTVPYAIAAGEPLGYWLSRIYGRLGVRLEAWGNRDGTILLNLCDGLPGESRLNGDGGVPMTFDPKRGPSTTNLVLDELGVNASAPVSGGGGGLLDSLDSAIRRFGRPGPVKDIVTAAGTSLEEAELRSGFGRASAELATFRVSMSSSQPALLPGRLITLPDEPGQGFQAVFGRREWQVAGTAHLCVKARYWNLLSLEDSVEAWKPAHPAEEGAAIVSGIVDDGKSEPGAQVDRDRLGRIPVRFPFVVDWSRYVETADNGGDGGNSATQDPWLPTIRLAPLAASAGNLHGFLSTHRQGDWCRVSVIHPMHAEVIGFSHRDDRFLGTGVRDASMGIVMRERNEDWRGLLFRPDEDLADEVPPGHGDSS